MQINRWRSTRSRRGGESKRARARRLNTKNGQKRNGINEKNAAKTVRARAQERASKRVRAKIKRASLWKLEVAAGELTLCEKKNKKNKKSTKWWLQLKQQRINFGACCERLSLLLLLLSICSYIIFCMLLENQLQLPTGRVSMWMSWMWMEWGWNLVLSPVECEQQQQQQKQISSNVQAAGQRCCCCCCC